MVDLVDELGFFPVIGSITIMIIFICNFEWSSFFFFNCFFTKLLKIGNAVFAPVSYFPNDLGLSNPT